MIYEGKDAARLFLSHFRIRRSDPDMGLLRQVVRRFAEIPYENITKIIKFNRHGSWEERLRRPAEVMEDHVALAAGGTCFSLTEALGAILRELGFDCLYRMADMRYGEDIHCNLVVILDGERYLVDPGYLLSEPVKIPDSGSVTVTTPFNNVRIEPADGGHDLFTSDRGGEKWRYKMKEADVSDERFKEHWIRSFSFNMMNSILITKATKEGHLYLRNRHFRRASLQSKETMKIREDYDMRLQELFGIDGAPVREALVILSDLKKGSWGREKG